MIDSERTWLLDTSIIVNVLRGTPLGRHVVENLQLRARPSISLVSVVSVGELFSLGLQLGWGEPKLVYLHELLAELVVIDINSELVLRRYADIDAWCIQNGVSGGKNDLWIAACASSTESLVLTADKDFGQMKSPLFDQFYLDPEADYSLGSA